MCMVLVSLLVNICLYRKGLAVGPLNSCFSLSLRKLISFFCFFLCSPTSTQSTHHHLWFSTSLPTFYPRSNVFWRLSHHIHVLLNIFPEISSLKIIRVPFKGYLFSLRVCCFSLPMSIFKFLLLTQKYFQWKLELHWIECMGIYWFSGMLL